VLRQRARRAAGVGIEDKGRRSPCTTAWRRQPARGARGTRRLLPQSWPKAAQVFGGKQVLNLVARGCPDKAAAMQALVVRCGAGAALFAGDDVNDEPVFERAPAHWLTVRVGSDDPRSSARVRLDGPSQMPRLLDLLLASRASCGPAVDQAHHGVEVLAREVGVGVDARASSWHLSWISRGISIAGPSAAPASWISQARCRIHSV
jgi:hypothetical protein